MDTTADGSRVFIVCGRSADQESLEKAFEPFGTITHVKCVKDKGVAYVRYDKASSAALAIENLNGAVLNNGRGPKLKVLLAEAPTARGVTPPKVHEAEISSDPDNVPPRSRLFIVVPKQAEAQQILEDMSKYSQLEYCKTDLIASKGVVFCKFSKSSAALQCLEDVQATGTIAGYKVKCMLAEPKTKRGRPDGSPQQDMFGHMNQAAKLDYGLGMAHEYAAINGLGSLAGGLGFNAALAGVSNMNNLAEMQGLGQVGPLFGSLGGLGNLQASPVSPNNTVGSHLSKQRLFVVVHKGVGEDLIARLFRRFPGMEYCDLKKDRATGKSKGYAYINYSTPEAAASAVEQLNGIEFPPHSGHRIKVFHAEPLGVRTSTTAGSRSPAMSMPNSTPSPMCTPMQRNMNNMSPGDMSSMNDGMQHLSVGRPTMEDLAERQARMTSPVAAAGDHVSLLL